MRTPKETVVLALTKIIEQGGCSTAHVNGHERCRYRSEVNGQKRACGVGHLIPDNVYTEEMEGKIPATINRLGLYSFPEDDYEILAPLQSCHDQFAGLADADAVTNFEKILEKVKLLPDDAGVDAVASIWW